MGLFNQKERDTVVNLLDLRPVRNLEYETGPEEKVVLLVPKFRARFAVRWFVPLLKKKVIRVKLDPYGSFVWTQCDGSVTVAEISDRMKGQFGETFDPTYARIRRFMQMFLKDKFLLPAAHQPGIE